MHAPRSLVFCALPLALRAQGTVSATADLSGPQTPLSFPMLSCIGSSHGEMLMWESYRDHIREAKRDIGFSFIRGHGLLDDDMSTYLNGAANLWPLFNAMDFLRSINMRPIFELSFTPGELAAEDTEWGHYRAITAPPKDYDAWYRFMADLLRGLEGRYGAEEVRLWKWEMYNEPNW
jgi:xylan 1,4-beta-xylosidase